VTKQSAKAPLDELAPRALAARSAGFFLNQSSIPEAREKSLSNTLSLFDAGPFLLILALRLCVFLRRDH
jgi:hypothetical protein